MVRSHGCELPGTYNPLIVRELFKQQCKPWGGPVDQLTCDILDASHFTVNSVLDCTTDEKTLFDMRLLFQSSMSSESLFR